jgi:hypothetical protein
MIHPSFLYLLTYFLFNNLSLLLPLLLILLYLFLKLFSNHSLRSLTNHSLRSLTKYSLRSLTKYSIRPLTKHSLGPLTKHSLRPFVYDSLLILLLKFIFSKTFTTSSSPIHSKVSYYFHLMSLNAKRLQSATYLLQLIFWFKKVL